MNTDPRRHADLPQDPQELLHLADRLLRGDSPTIAGIDRGLAALRRARSSERQSFEIDWRLCQGTFAMTQLLKTRHERVSYAKRGVTYCEQAIRSAPKRVEGHYYLALNLAKVAEARGDLGLVKPMLAIAQRARTLDERFDSAGPLVFIGKVFLTAPPWPMSVGNPEKAIAALERAMKLAPRPLTRLFLGQAYFQDEQYERAEKELKRALKDGADLPPRWKNEARDYLRRIREEAARRSALKTSRAA